MRENSLRKWEGLQNELQVRRTQKSHFVDQSVDAMI